MPPISFRARQVLSHPGAFLLRIARSFQANQGLLLAGAVAYYALLSLVPLVIISVIVLSNYVEQAELMRTLDRYLDWLVPSQSQAVLRELEHFLTHRTAIGSVLVVTMLFFSSLAFSVLESAMATIFRHRVEARRRHYLISALLPYCYVVLLTLGLLLVTVVSSYLQLADARQVHLFGLSWATDPGTGALLYLLGFCGEIFFVTSIYLVMPVGRIRLKHALLGSVAAATIWEFVRHALIWYFASMSQVGVVYGSLTSAIVILLSLEIAAGLLLLGAQVISEYERLVPAVPDKG